MGTKKAHVLLVDDDPIILTILEDILTSHNFLVTCALSGAEALTLLKKNPTHFSAIILDRMMPQLSGIDVLHKIYTHKSLSHIPIVMLTSHAEREDVSAAVVAGVFDFLYKPIDPDLLILVLKRALSHDSGTQKSS